MGVRGKRAEKPNGETKAAATEASPGVGHNQLTDDQRAALTFDWRKKYETALNAKKKAEADFKNTCKSARADLGDTAVDDIKSMIAMESEEGEAKIRSELERQMKVARWMGMPFGSQSDMFGEDRTPAVDRAYALGKKAGLAGESMQPPHAPGVPQHQTWLEGWHDGQAVVSKGFKPLTPIENAAQAAQEKSDAVDSLVH